MYNELYHFLKLGEEAKKHKYVARINIGTKQKPVYRYFYSKLAYDAYLKRQNANNQLNNQKNSIFSSLFNKISSVSNSLLSKGKQIVNNISKPSAKTNSISKTLSNITSKAISSIPKSTVSKGKDVINKLVYNISKSTNAKAKESSNKAVSKSSSIKKESNKSSKSLADTVKTAIKTGEKAVLNVINKIGNKKLSTVSIGSPTDDWEKANEDYEDYEDKKLKYRYETEKEYKDDYSYLWNTEKYYTKYDLNDRYNLRDKIEKTKLAITTASVLFGGIFGLIGSIPLSNLLTKKDSDTVNDILENKGKTSSELSKEAEEYANERVNEKYSVTDKYVKADYERAMYDYDRYQKYIKDQMNASNPSSFKDLKKKTKEYTAEEDMDYVNPYYDESGSAWTENCAYCTAAYELRRRGYDVEANSSPYTNGNEPNTVHEIVKWYDGIERVDEFKEADLIVQLYEGSITNAEYISKLYNGTVSAYMVDPTSRQDVKTKTNDIKKEILKQGEGARGQFMTYWYNGGGHSIVYEVVNGDVILRDTQTNDIVNVESYVSRSEEILFFRTDDKELTDEILKTVKNKKKQTKSDKNDYYE